MTGDDSLGWMNSITGDLLPVADPSCPLLTVAGRDYTRYPCVARVAPGRAFDFYLRLTNAGTNPATELRLVDVFPAPGDTGVILTGEQRGTQWDEPPTLLTPVTLEGPGALDAAYTTDNPACTTDLNRPPVTCATGVGRGLRPGGDRVPRLRTFAGPRCPRVVHGAPVPDGRAELPGRPVGERDRLELVRAHRVLRRQRPHGAAATDRADQDRDRAGLRRLDGDQGVVG